MKFSLDTKIIKPENNNIKFLQVNLWQNQNRDLNQDGYNESIKKLAIAINDCIE